MNPSTRHSRTAVCSETSVVQETSIKKTEPVAQQSTDNASHGNQITGFRTASNGKDTTIKRRFALVLQSLREAWSLSMLMDTGRWSRPTPTLGLPSCTLQASQLKPEPPRHACHHYLRKESQCKAPWTSERKRQSDGQLSPRP